MLAVIDYGSGNIRSVCKALVSVNAENVVVTSDPMLIGRADKIVLPGVGAYAQCMAGLAQVEDLINALNQRVIAEGVPFLGICVGMQLLAERGIEFEITQGLGWIKGEVTKLEPKDKELKIPHMGWNTALPQNNEIFSSAWNNQAKDVYFVHSYAFRAAHQSDIAAICQYGADIFPAAIAKDNILGLQFHPEKSQKAGLQLLEAWLKPNNITK
jgi:glutamine amidotransferase